MRERALENGSFRSDASQVDFGQVHKEKLLGPTTRRSCVDRVRAEWDASELLVCHTLRQHRSIQRKVPTGRFDGELRVADMIVLTGRSSAWFIGGSRSR